jgi:hypothetical protein
LLLCLLDVFLQESQFHASSCINLLTYSLSVLSLTVGLVQYRMIMNKRQKVTPPRFNSVCASPKLATTQQFPRLGNW